MRVILLSLCGWLFAANAFADCSAMPERVIEVTIDEVSAPVYDVEGKLQKGCILSGGGTVLGYTSEDKLCHMKIGKTIKVRQFYSGCCDTGFYPGGDFTCVPRLGISQNGGQTKLKFCSRRS